MTIPVIEVPNAKDFEGSISEQDIADLPNRDKKTVLAVSRLEQCLNHRGLILQEFNQYLRLLEAESIRARQERNKLKDEQKETKVAYQLLKWAAMTLGAALGSILVQKLWK